VLSLTEHFLSNDISYSTDVYILAQPKQGIKGFFPPNGGLVHGQAVVVSFFMFLRIDTVNVLSRPIAWYGAASTTGLAPADFACS
jgi:hypothetical protein